MTAGDMPSLEPQTPDCQCRTIGAFVMQCVVWGYGNSASCWPACWGVTFEIHRKSAIMV